jgi:hypothetical protein
VNLHKSQGVYFSFFTIRHLPLTQIDVKYLATRLKALPEKAPQRKECKASFVVAFRFLMDSDHLGFANSAMLDFQI